MDIKLLIKIVINQIKPMRFGNTIEGFYKHKCSECFLNAICCWTEQRHELATNDKKTFEIYGCYLHPGIYRKLL